MAFCDQAQVSHPNISQTITNREDAPGNYLPIDTLKQLLELLQSSMIGLESSWITQDCFDHPARLAVSTVKPSHREEGLK
jgi:hypothetical protein